MSGQVGRKSERQPRAVIIPGSIVHGQILIAGFIGYYNRISLSKFDYNSYSLWIE
jgi:hypothetical protein